MGRRLLMWWRFLRRRRRRFRIRERKRWRSGGGGTKCSLSAVAEKSTGEEWTWGGFELGLLSFHGGKTVKALVSRIYTAVVFSPQSFTIY